MCFSDESRPPLPPIAGGVAQGEDIVITASDGNRFAACLAGPQGPPRAQAVILPDVRGLYPFYKELALRFAEQGITALAIDYFGRTAGLTSRDEPFEYLRHADQLHFTDVRTDIAAALAYLRGWEGGRLPTFTVGFCMGGSLSLLAGTQDFGMAGVIGFYTGFKRDFGGYGTALDHAAEIKCPVLGLYGGADQSIPQTQIDQLDGVLRRVGVEHELVTYPGAPHSFFDRHAEKYADASADAWQRVLGFIAAHSQR